MTGDLLGQALAYAARGWPVFPCKPGRKVPAIPSAHEPGNPCRGECGREGHGFLDAVTDPAVITAWWRRWPNANIGVATGAPGPDVLDVDVKHAGSGFAALNRVKRAGLITGASALVVTRSRGLHLYFTGTSQTCGRLPRHFLDFKAAGGYVIVPPSFVAADDTGPAGVYELLEERDADGRLDWAAVRRLLDPPKPRATRSRQDTSQDGLVAFVAGLAEGNRNNGLFWAACRAIEHGGDLDQLVAVSTLPEIEARRTVASAARKAGQ